MNQADIVSWKEIQGNRYNRGLHLAMLTDTGFLVTAKGRVIGNVKYGSEFITIRYDRDYVIDWLRVKVIKPLVGISFNEIVELLKEAQGKTGIEILPLEAIGDSEE